MIAATYWTLSGLLVVFGFITGFSIGIPFLFLGLTLIALGPVRRKTTVFWPILVAVIGFWVGFILVTPLGCTTSATRVVNGNSSTQQSATHCSNLLGIDYSGTSLYNPSQMPALLAGLSSAALSGMATVVITRRGASP